MKIGYIRVSRDKQTTALQEDAMRQERCERTFTDKMSGKRFDRPEFLKMLDMARSGDVIVVWRFGLVPNVEESGWRRACQGNALAAYPTFFVKIAPIGQIINGFTPSFSMFPGKIIYTDMFYLFNYLCLTSHPFCDTFYGFHIL